jgi:hypothetical protein
MASYAAVERLEAAPVPSERRPLRLFLSGPITGLSYRGACDWRTHVRSRLGVEAPHVECGDPMRGRRHLADVERIDTESHKNGLLDGHAAVARDLWDVDRCDVLLMNLTGACDVSIGSMVELGRASSKGKFVIVVLPSDELGEEAGPNRNPHDHLFIHELASVVVDTVDEALYVVTTL